MILSPSLLSANAAAFGSELEKLEKSGIRWAHFDVMDGSFVPNITFGQHVIKALRANSKLFFDVHLMINNPERHIEAFAEAGTDLLIIHAENSIHLDKNLTLIKECNMKVGLAINPATDINCLNYVLDKLDLILVMSVNPGFGGQKFIPSSFDKIKKIKQKIVDAKKKCLISVDGGVEVANAKELVIAGADILVSGSAFFKNEDYLKSLLAFNNAVSAK